MTVWLTTPQIFATSKAEKTRCFWVAGIDWGTPSQNPFWQG
jgi:hypothetical protein